MILKRNAPALEYQADPAGVWDERQISTQKKIKVNAQITLVLWLLESFNFVADLIIYAVFQSLGKTKFTQNMVLFLVILPYSYLANTSDNKRRIAEEGWKNVLRNIFSVNCKTNNDSNNLTRVYVISSNTRTDSNEATEGDDTVVNRTFQKESNSCTPNHNNPHVPTREVVSNSTDTKKASKNDRRMITIINQIIQNQE